ncbi:N-acetylmuramoyl-L-alanine amidase [Roseobacter sp. A03A-229]
MIERPSPNFGPRRNGLTPSIIVLHYTAMASAEAAIKRLCDPDTEVSAHYLICRRGEVTRLVAEDQRAWHAGVGEWRGETDINSRSIGIELDNAGDHPFPEPQIAALETLMRDIRARWTIAPENIIGHSDMAPGRKSDPGSRFDWARFARQGLAAQSGPGRAAAPVTPEAFRARAQAAGFTVKADDATLLAAVRLRFRPHATGPLSIDDLTALPTR